MSITEKIHNDKRFKKAFWILVFIGFIIYMPTVRVDLFRGLAELGGHSLGSYIFLYSMYWIYYKKKLKGSGKNPPV